MTRLRSDVGGNTIALAAAAMVPLAGLIGGGVDMSRLYLTKTRLQQACDAGALAGRKAMGGGAWTTGKDSAHEKANQLFAANFLDGAYGTDALTSNFAENEGTVTGTATVSVPMTIMRVFGMTERNLTVSCTAKMEIPNTDVMFVLDVTGSMRGSKITGLHSAVKCFYEALLKVHTAEICDGKDGKTDPSATEYTGTAQIRLGFVPYGVNVNVGYLLPHAHMADSWTYQSRVPNLTRVYAWTLGTESAISGWGNWPTAPTNRNNQSTYSNWGDISTSGGSTVNVNGTNRTKRPTGLNSTTCAALNTMGTSPNKMLDYVDNGSVQNASLLSTTNNPPTYPASQQVLSYEQDDNHSVTGYKYVWNTSGNGSCRLQSGTRTYTLTRTGGKSTKSITWTDYDRVDNWTYRPVTFDQIASLKDGTSAWNTSVLLPVAETNSPSIRLSGSNTSGTIKLASDLSVSWGGCIEEARTYQNTDGDPRDDWDPIPNVALDMQVNLIPDLSDPDTLWGPMLQNAVWGRWSGSTSNRHFNPLVANSSLSRNVGYYCPSTPARKLAEYNTVGDLEAYVDSLTADAVGTYHDIGMLWGGRLLSPTGIFASENEATSKGGPIQRHLIFMTDGNAETFENNMTAYGHPFYDRRQTSYAPTTTQTNQLVEARLTALCTQIKNMNITLWVISYGGGVNKTNEQRLEACATSGRYYSASNGAALIARFQQIASEIAELRLIS